MCELCMRTCVHQNWLLVRLSGVTTCNGEGRLQGAMGELIAR